MRCTAPVRNWRKPSDEVSPCGNTTITGWARKEGQSRRLNTTQKSWYSATWTINHFCAPHLGVVDATCGTGTSGDAALRSGRSFLGIDICPDAVAATQRRLEAVRWEEMGRLAGAGLISMVDTEQEEARQRLLDVAVAKDDRTMASEDAAKCRDHCKAAIDRSRGLLEKSDAELDRWLQAALVYFQHCSPSTATSFLKKPIREVATWVMDRLELRNIVNAARTAQEWPDIAEGTDISASMWELTRETE